MTPQEKAQELFGKYAMYLRANLLYDEEANEDAKQCVLIAVDEILKLSTFFNLIAETEYWNEVKIEIEKL